MSPRPDDSRGRRRPLEGARELAAPYDALPDGVLVETAGTWVYANPAALKMLGYDDAGDLIGRSVLEIVPPENHELVLRCARNVAAGGRNAPQRIPLIRADGLIIETEVTSQALNVSHGQTAALILVRDITERLAEETRFRLTFEQAAVGMAHLSPDGRWLRVNRRLAAMVGYEIEELLQRTFHDITHPDDRAIGRDQCKRLLTGEIETFSCEMRHLRKDGATISVRVTVSLARSVSGAPEYLIAVVQDITEARAAQEALRASEERFRRLVEFGSELIVVVDPSGVMTYISPTVMTLLGYSPEQVIGLSAFSFVHPDDLPASVERIQRVLRLPGARERATIRLRSAAEGWRTFEISTVNLLDDPGVRGIVINGHDTTVAMRIADELAQMRRVESLGRVAAAVAHEFNNILAAADAFTTVLARKADKSFEPIVRGLRNAISRGKQTTIPILHYGQPAAISRANFSIADWLRDLKDETEALIGGRNPLSFEVSGIERLTGDRRQLSQMLTNLILNARDASPAGSPITVTVSGGDDGGVVFCVRDLGHGIAPEIQDRVFEPLFTTKHNGTGLGLALVQQIVVRHGGTVSFASDPGCGSTFTVTLP